MRIIVNADDFGFSEEVNNAIVEYAHCGLITSTTVLANAPFFYQAINLKKKFPKNISMGVHLNLTEFQPITIKNSEIHVNSMQSARQWGYLKIYEELCAQVERVMETGISISHFDSHHHVHTTPTLLPVVMVLAKKYGVKKIRISKNLFRGKVGSIKKIKKFAFNKIIKNIAGFRSADYFTSYSDFIAAKNRVSFDSTVELMCHPGAHNFSNENELIESQILLNTLKDINLISYDDL